MKILVVDDDVTSRLLLEHLLTKQGHQCLLAEDGKKAWELFLREKVRVVVSDWMMPEMDGLELCRNIREHPSQLYTYFLLLTAKTEREDYHSAMDHGVDDFLTKPLNSMELAMRLRVANRIVDFGQQIESLQEILPICMYCKNVRTDGDYWERFEAYFKKYKDTNFSHGICPDCYTKVVLPQLEENFPETSGNKDGEKDR